MYILRALPLLAATLAAAQQKQQQQQGYLGFNSGATIDDHTPKQQSDFEQEFKTAQGLHFSPGLFNSVRLYTNIQKDTTSDPISAFPAALATNTSMLLGIWTSGTDDITNELTALKAALDEHGAKFADLVLGISVGSEDLYRISESGIENKSNVGTGPKEIVAFIKEVRNAIKDTLLRDKPVGHVDAWSAWANSSNAAVIKAVDFVGTDLYPYYEKDKGNHFSNLTNVWDYIYKQTTKVAGNKPVWITEVGWPSNGPTWGEAEASVENAKGFWDQIGCSLFGRTNVWWYNLRDSNPDNKEKFAITKDLDTEPIFNLTCPAGSGAPAAINTVSSATRMASSLTYMSVFMLLGFVWSI